MDVRDGVVRGLQAGAKKRTVKLLERWPLVAAWPARNPTEARGRAHRATKALPCHWAFLPPRAMKFGADDALVELDIVRDQDFGGCEVFGERRERMSDLDPEAARRLRRDAMNTRRARGNLEAIRANDEGLATQLIAAFVGEDPRDLDKARRATEQVRAAAGRAGSLTLKELV